MKTDQSKIRLGEPKPATGQRLTVASEWTAAMVELIFDMNGGSKGVAEAHNTAVAAERRMVEQLEGALHHPDDPNHTCLFKQQLTAERKGHEMDGQLISSQESEISQLRQQLAAEREKVQTLVDALKRIAKGLWPPDSAKVANDALAKVNLTPDKKEVIQ